jgi:eukaryotic-like serine/threonine-protein kinase
MDPTRWNRIEEILQQALDLEPAARPAYLDEACGGDAELRREVEALLHGESLLKTDRPAVAWLSAELAGGALRGGEQLGRYRIGRRIGAGGMGEVYEAGDDVLQRTVAIKLLPPELSADADRVQRFGQEALAASRLNHPNIITIFEIVHLDGTHFIVAERVEGETLRSLLTDPQTGTPGSLEVRRALDVAAQIAAALHAAHAASIVHRDIKPENIMVRSDGLVKVLDFGIAKMEGAQSSHFDHLTVPGAILGTASYMSPEQLRGDPLDERTDLFSLGVVLYEMLSGERPFTGATRAETTTVHLDQALPSTNRLGHLPGDLQRIIRKLLEPEREARYRSAAAALEELRAAQRRIEGQRARTIARVSLGAALVLLVLGVVGTWLTFTETWQERVLRDGHTAAARQAVLSPDGRLLVSCGEDGQVIVWDFARRQRLKTLDLLAHMLAFSPDGRWFATGGTDGAVTIWDAARWTPLRVLGGHRAAIRALTVSPDGSMLAAASTDQIILWRVRGWQKLHEWDEGTAYGTFVFSRDGRQILYGATFRHIFDTATGQRVPVEPPDDGATWLALSADARRIATIGPDGALMVLRVGEGGAFDRLEQIARRPGHQDNGRSVAFSPDGRLIASAADDIVLWNAETYEKLARLEYASVVWSVVFSPDGRWLVSTHADGAVLVWDVVERARASSFNEHSAAVRAVAFSPDGGTIASGSEDRSIMLWDLRLGRKTAVLLGHGTRVLALAFPRHAGRRLASGDFLGRVVVWDALQPRVSMQETVVLCLAMSPDGSRIATTQGVYDASDGRLLLDFEKTTLASIRYRGHPFVYGVSFSADGRRLAAVTEGGLVMVWDARALRLLGIQLIPNTAQISVSLSADGERMVTGEDEGAVRLWNVSPLRQEAILGRHAARVKSVAFAPDGKTAASAGDDKTIALWDLRRRRLRTRIGTHTSPVYAVAFSPDGRQLASGEHDRSVRIYTRQRTVWGVGWE